MIASAFLCLSLFFAAQVQADSGVEDLLDDVVDPIEDTAPTRKGAQFVYLPIPMSNPTIGTGLAFATMALFKLDEESPVSNAAVGAMYTDTDSWGVGGKTEINFHDDEFRINGGLGYFDLNLDFFGVGFSVGENAISIPINQRGGVALAEFLWLLGKKLYLGPRYRYLEVESTFPGPLNPFTIVSSGPGLKLQWDTRDNPLNPYTGQKVDFTIDTSMESLGSDRDYQTFNASYSRYFDLGEHRIIAARATACAASDNSPFYDICLFGASNALRGYIAGQYRDRRMVTVEGEYRWRFGKRMGMVFFAGIGQVADQFSDFNTADILPSAGVGVRFLASKEHRVNISIDYAVGDDSDALYFYIGEAF